MPPPSGIPAYDADNLLPRLADDHVLRRHCTVTIAIADIYHVNGGPIAFEEVAQEHHQNLEIDMYQVLRAIDRVKTRNFGHESLIKKAPPVQP